VQRAVTASLSVADLTGSGLSSGLKDWIHMRTVLLLLITAAASAPDTADGADCEPSAEVVDDLQFAIDTSEQSETESVVATISPLSPAGGPLPEEVTYSEIAPSSVEWANQFFITQIYDPRWNPSGNVADTTSNSCGPASLAMMMAAEGTAPANITTEIAIDYARAAMYPSYPEIDPSELPEGASLYEAAGLILVKDDAHSVYFDQTETGPSLAQGISYVGANPVFGYSWDELDALIESSGAVIAHGHITDAWVGRFTGEYGEVESGAIPHFIALFPSTNEGEYVVSDPMNKGGAVVMSQQDLQTFFKSPVNQYDTSIRVVTWDTPPRHN
jgi:hypothetical protein